MPSSRLAPPVYRPLPLGSIRPRGWLRKQLQIQADGLSGHLDEFWPDVARSGWIGGDAEGWERGPYWLDGVTPLAFLLDDARLTRKVQSWFDHVLEHQHDDGWLGPIHDLRYGYKYDPWPAGIFLKALTQYAEATGDARVEPTMRRFFVRLHQAIAEQPLQTWISVRWADLLLTIDWLYERCGDASLLDLADMLHAQGYDWRRHFETFGFAHKTDFQTTCANGTFLHTHGVNNAMALRQPALWYRHSHDKADRDCVGTMLAALDRYHGQATGVFSCDEHLAGLSPSQGTELCTVVELMYSLELLAGLTGDPRLGDRLERIAYNALPASCSADMWSHQYVQQANQVLCALSESRVYTDNGPDANIFGLEPNFGCCTANMHQGWPKFASHLWMRSDDDGLAAIAYGPCDVRTEVDGRPVRLSVRTTYPFEDGVRITVRCDSSVRMPLELRIPAWCDGATIVLDDGTVETARPGTFHCVERTWRNEESLELRLPAALVAEPRYNGAVALSRGPLVYALAIGEDWRQIGGEAPHADYEVHPATPWNYALRLDKKNPSATITVARRDLGDRPFSPDGAPIVAHAPARQVRSWTMQDGAAAPPPRSPLSSVQPEETVTLLPYGCARLRVTELPYLAP